MKQNSTIKLYAGLFAVLFISIIVAYGVLSNPDTNISTTDTSTTVVSQTDTTASTIATSTSSEPNPNTGQDALIQASTTTTTQTTAYKDGTYTATGIYATPTNSRETINVTLTIAQDTITAVSTTDNAQSPESKFYNTKFREGITGVMVGKSIEDVAPNQVNGSSLTSQGFNNALNLIRTEAKL